MEITALGIDLAKSVFQVHGVDAGGRAILKKKLRRRSILEFLQGLPPCLIGMEACATAHYWAREIVALGHEVRLIPPAYVKPYVKRQKNDAADAEAICEAVTRPNMRFVPIKTPEQQGVMVLHRTRELLIRQRTMMLNALRSHLAEFGIVAAKGPRNVMGLVAELRAGEHVNLPEIARTALLGFASALEALTAEIRSTSSKAMPLPSSSSPARSRTSPTSRRRFRARDSSAPAACAPAP
jgi:transposase